jgi:hypothetical protein
MKKNKESSANEQVAQYFKENSNKLTALVTSDGFIFEQYKYALDHANTLAESEQEIETFKNPSHVEAKSDEVKE